MTRTYISLIAGGVSTRQAAVLTGMVRSTATRRLNAATAPTPALQSDAAASKPQVAALLLPPAARTLSDATPANAGVAPATAKATTLQVIFRGKSWIDVKDAQGASVLTMTGNDGATRTLDASPPLDVVVGNADHVDVIFRGQHIDLAAHAKQNVARLQLR